MIELLTVANHVEAINGLLYMSGGGWTDHHRIVGPDQPPPPTHMGIAASVLIPWEQTNQQHTLVIRVEDADGAIMLQSPDIPINAGRPANLEPGSDQHAIVAIVLDFSFPRSGAYRLIARYDGDEDNERRWVFRVHDDPPPNATQ